MRFGKVEIERKGRKHEMREAESESESESESEKEREAERGTRRKEKRGEPKETQNILFSALQQCSSNSTNSFHFASVVSFRATCFSSIEWQPLGARLPNSFQ